MSCKLTQLDAGVVSFESEYYETIWLYTCDVTHHRRLIRLRRIVGSLGVASGYNLELMALCIVNTND
jgi:hypothetical protein